jgi:DNA-binding transcriptional LysR family regulator
MEMHQVRYFLAVARLLNFTRAAEECHVAQPSLTRAIKQLEEELGGELFRRERNLTHLTELGQRMLPLIQQCYDSAQAAKQIASSITKGEVGALSVALPVTVNIELVLPFLKELVRAMPGLNLKFLRGSAADISEHLKKGNADVAVAGRLAETWDRLESWSLFTEPFRLVVTKEHRLNDFETIPAEELRNEKLICRPYCEEFERGEALLSARGVEVSSSHNACTESDFAALLKAGLGVGFAPESCAAFAGLALVDVEGFAMDRTVFAYAVAGRRRSTAASTFIKMLRAVDWARVEARATAA